MGQAIGGSLPMAIGIALSPVAIIAVVLMLTTEKARVNGPAFTLGWLLGLGIIGVIVLVIAGPADASNSGAPAPWVSCHPPIQQPPARGRTARNAQMDGHNRQIQSGRCARRRGLAHCGEPEEPAAGRGRRGHDHTDQDLRRQQAIAYLVFAVLGTIGVAIPTGIYFAMGKRSVDLLGKLKDWMGQHNAVIMTVLCLIISVKLIGDAISALSG